MMSCEMSTDIAPATGSDDTAPGEPVTAPRGPVTSASYSITVRLTSDGDPASASAASRPPWGPPAAR